MSSMIRWPVSLSRLAVGSSARTMSGPRHQGAGDGHPLALPAGQLVGLVLQPVGQLHLLDEVHDDLLPLLARVPVAEEQGNSMFS